ncbi:MAG: NAD(P)H-binding protein [Leptolyngbya sp.]|nr:NAD(P)H-binding protein [Candidatus Melainabacteria bacterium]
MNVAITGGTGFIGSHLARALVSRGDFPRVLARGINNRDDSIRRLTNASFTPVSMSDEKKLFQSFQGCDVVAHLAGIRYEPNTGDFEKTHVESTIKVIHAARKAGVSKIVYVSCQRARPKCFNKFYESKWEAEQLIRASEIDYTVLKPSIVFGRGDFFLTAIKRMLDKGSMVSSIGLFEKKINPVAVEDLIEILLAGLIEGHFSGETLNVEGPEALTFSEAVKRVGRVVKKSAVLVPSLVSMQFAKAQEEEKTTKEAILTRTLVRMIADGNQAPVDPCDKLPVEILPKRLFNDEQIIRALG